MIIAENFEKIIEKITDIETRLKVLGFDVDLESFGGCEVILAKKKFSKKHLILQSGLHGIEGYVGFSMIYYFVMNMLKDDFDYTFIINANPFGVKNKRRVNENNVDLNRNFLVKEEDFTKMKDDYSLIDSVINPRKKIKSFFLSYIKTIYSILKLVLKVGAAKFKHTLLCGQRYNSNGAYFMGDGFQKQTIFLKELYKRLFAQKGFENTVFLDLHTGYGPKYQMSIVNSSLMKNEKILTSLIKSYPLVVQSNTSSFYEMKGDLIDFIYKVYPTIHYATSFEFGTFGDSVFAGIKSIVAIVLENQYFYNNQNGQTKRSDDLDKVGEKVLSFYENAYFPKDKRWWKKAISDFEKGMDTIINLIK